MTDDLEYFFFYANFVIGCVMIVVESGISSIIKKPTTVFVYRLYFKAICIYKAMVHLQIIHFSITSRGCFNCVFGIKENDLKNLFVKTNCPQHNFHNSVRIAIGARSSIFEKSRSSVSNTSRNPN